MNKFDLFRRLLFTTGIISFILIVHAQDLHYADVQSMNIWYNQSLKTDMKADLRLDYRDVRYQSLLAFHSGGALINLPFLKNKVGSGYKSKSYLNFTAGGNFDQSNAGIFKNNTYMLGISYAQHLSANQTYLSVGFQGTNTRSVFGSSTVTYPDQFDQYGPLSSATRDPLNAGRSYNWNSLNAGVSVFQYTDAKDWYLGASIRHINKPYTDEWKTEAYRLAPTVGMQAGLTFKNEFDQFAVYGIANWIAKAYEYLIGISFNKIITQTDEKAIRTSIGAGIALRVRDAIIPNIQLKYNKTVIGLHYDMNLSGLKAAGYSRQAFELALTQQLN